MTVYISFFLTKRILSHGEGRSKGHRLPAGTQGRKIACKVKGEENSTSLKPSQGQQADTGPGWSGKAEGPGP